MDFRVKEVKAAKVEISYGDPKPDCKYCKGKGREKPFPCSCQARFGKPVEVDLFVAISKQKDEVLLDFEEKKKTGGD